MVALVLLASCTLPRPGIELSIAGTSVTSSREGSYRQGGGCSGACGDGPAPAAPLTTVRAAAPIRLDFSAGAEVKGIHADIFLGSGMVGAPIESFTLRASARSHTSAQLRSGRYYILVTIGWDRLIDRGDTRRAFLVEIVPP